MKRDGLKPQQELEAELRKSLLATDGVWDRKCVTGVRKPLLWCARRGRKPRSQCLGIEASGSELWGHPEAPSDRN